MMKKIFFTVVILTTVITTQAQKELQTFKKINKEVLNNSQAYATLKHSGETIGHRLTGSANGAKAEQYAYDLFTKYGFKDVQFQPFEVVSWSRESVSFSIRNNGVEQTYKAVTLAHSPVSVDLQHAEIVDLGNGLEADYLQNPDKAKGKVVFASLGLLPNSPAGTKNLHRSEKTALAIKYGAKGIILFNGVKGGILLTGTASVTGDLIPIPAVNISNEDGWAIKELLNTRPLQVSIKMKNHSGPIKARNVIATLPGKKYPNEKIVIGGHLDSWDLANGAIDNGIGSFSIIDIARTFKALNLKTDRTIEFVMFMGEEQGLLGSTHYVENAIKSNTLENVVYMVNYDMAGNAIGFTAGGRKEADAFFKSVGELVKQVDTAFPNQSGAGGAGLHSDHEPFMLQGVPTASSSSRMDRKIYDCYHADCDATNLIDPSWMVNQVRFASMFLYALANAKELPAKKMSDEETKQFLINANLKEALKIAGDWRWKD
jgi:carboxypeptidase Q